MAIGDVGGGKGGVVEDVAVDVEGDVDAASVAVGVDEDVIGDDVRDDVGLIEEEGKEGDDIIKATGAKHGGGDSIAGEDGGAN